MSDYPKDWNFPLNDRLSNPEQVREIESIPLSSRDLPSSIYDVLKINAKKYKDKTALKYLPNGLTNDIPDNVTHIDLLQKSTQTANLLYDLGITKEDVIAIIAPDIVETMYAMLGAETSGIALPVPAYLEPEQMVSIINRCLPKVLIVFGFHKEFDTWRKFQLIRKKLPSVEHFIVINTHDEIPENASDFKWLDYHSEINKQPTDILKSNRVFSPSDVALLASTSGTTGTSKIVKRTHGNQIYFIWSQLLSLGVVENECTIHGFPLCDRDLIFLAHLTAFSVGGSTVVLGPKGFFDNNVINHYWNIVNKYKATSLMGSPHIIQQLLDSASIEGKEFPSVNSMIYSGQKLSPALYKRFKEKTRIPLLQTYALAEATFLGTHYLNDTDEVDCIGIRNPYIELKVAKVDNDDTYISDCAKGELGNLFMRGPNLSYYLDDELNQKRWTNDGWFNTGDIVKQDQNDNFRYIGRTYNQIRINGSFMNPEIIENQINKFPEVIESVVVNMPHDDFIEVPVVFVVLAENALQQQMTRNIEQFMYDEYATYSVVIVKESLNKMQSGKTDRIQLSCEAIKTALEKYISSKDKVAFHVTADDYIFKIQIHTLDDSEVLQREEIITKLESQLELARFSYKIH